MKEILNDRIQMILKSIPKSNFLTFFGLPVHSALLQRASFIFPSPNRTLRTPWSSFEKISIKKIVIKNYCISPTCTSNDFGVISKVSYGFLFLTCTPQRFLIFSTNQKVENSMLLSKKFFRSIFFDVNPIYQPKKIFSRRQNRRWKSILLISIEIIY